MYIRKNTNPKKESGDGFLFSGKAMTSIDNTTNQGDTLWSTIIFFKSIVKLTSGCKIMAQEL